MPRTSARSFVLIGNHGAFASSKFVHRVFFAFRFRRIDAKGTDQGSHRNSGESEADGQADNAGSLLRRRTHPHTPSNSHRPNTVGEVEDAGADSDRVENRNEEGALHRKSQAGGRVVRTELRSTQRLRNRFKPRLEMEPAVKMKDVSEDEEQRDHARGSLSHVPPVRGVRIVCDVGTSRVDDHDAEDRVEQNRQEDESPLDEQERRSKRMDLIDRILERSDSHHRERIRQQVNDHVRADGDQTRERVQAPQKEFVTHEKRRRR